MSHVIKSHPSSWYTVLYCWYDLYHLIWISDIIHWRSIVMKGNCIDHGPWRFPIRKCQLVRLQAMVNNPVTLCYDIIQWYRAQCKAAVAVVVTSCAGGSGWCRILRQPVAPRLAHSMLPLKILPSSVLLTLGLLAAVVSGQQQRRVIGFDAEGRITIQVQLPTSVVHFHFRQFIVTHLPSLICLQCNAKL